MRNKQDSRKAEYLHSILKVFVINVSPKKNLQMNLGICKKPGKKNPRKSVTSADDREEKNYFLAAMSSSIARVRDLGLSIDWAPTLSQMILASTPRARPTPNITV